MQMIDYFKLLINMEKVYHSEIETMVNMILLEYNNKKKGS